MYLKLVLADKKAFFIDKNYVPSSLQAVISLKAMIMQVTNL